ncbi:MAG: TadE/TadG family type IV pilus assembly protein [Bacillota bacterium]|uniref:Pilus assembly protein n=1 Tax=Thermanaerosceptrum fracticalcis TaxID=1712410 RepID=A0A7G6E4C1_THEFR|nr:TadE family protein [Thermanaerosceptrum fracticalcis]QNB46925.1 pilus assembly protein [Thermanaerosceptrum fracticalcis]
MWKKIAQKEKGQALVEMALILPLLLLLVFGIIEFGRIFSAGLVVNHGAREGARLGAVGALDSAIVTRVQNTAVTLDTSQLSVTVTPTETDRKRGGEVRVRVRYPVVVFAPFISVFTGETVTVEGISVMRVE